MTKSLLFFVPLFYLALHFSRHPRLLHTSTPWSMTVSITGNGMGPWSNGAPMTKKEGRLRKKSVADSVTGSRGVREQEIN